MYYLAEGFFTLSLIEISPALEYPEAQIVTEYVVDIEDSDEGPFIHPLPLQKVDEAFSACDVALIGYLEHAREIGELVSEIEVSSLRSQKLLLYFTFAH